MNIISVASRPKVTVVNCYGHPKMSPKIIKGVIFFSYINFKIKQWAVLCSIKNKTIQHQKKWINKAKKNSLLIRVFLLIKNVHKKLLLMLFFRVSWKTTLSKEIKDNLLPWYKVTCKRKTHFFKGSITWYLHWKQVTNKKVVKLSKYFTKD